MSVKCYKRGRKKFCDDTYEAAMSRGISRQQRQILGLAVALARRRNPKRKLVAADPTDEPDITVAFAAVVAGGVALVQKTRSSGSRGPHFISQDRSPAGLSARASIDRAFGSLVRRGLLTPCKPQRYNRLDNPNHEGRYHLTEAGMAAGLPYEMPITEEMRPILWLLDRSTEYTAFVDYPARIPPERRAVLMHEAEASEP